MRSKRNSKHIKKKNKRIRDKEPKVMSEERKRFIRKLNGLFVIVYAIFCVYSLIEYFSWRSIALQMMQNQHSSIVDSNGNIIEELGIEKSQNNIELSQIPDNLKNAYIDIEDQRFYSHKGIDVKRTGAAIASYVLHGGKSSFGGSSITQQLVKNLTGNDDNSISRKVDEWVKAASLESFCNKDDILETYLNIIYVAPKTYGVDMGARYYFNKSVSDLDLAECAFLAGINNSPNSYNPFNGKDNSDKIKKRTKTVLSKMLELGHISQSDYELAIQEVENGLNFNNGDTTPKGDGIYSYHTDALLSEVISEIADKKNIDTAFATNYVYMSGLTIYSTVNSDIQNEMENEYVKNKNVIIAENDEKSQSAMVIIDHSTGNVVGCVGGLGEKTTSRGFNRATQAVRQTGSAIKPIAVLAPGIDKKVFTPATIYNDEPTTFNDGSEEVYSPTDNDEYIGEITVRRAVESSQNIPFVKMMEQVTPKTSIQYLKKMGITSLTEKDECLPLALGGLDKGITPLEMAGAYATIANNGTYIEPTFYTKVTNSKGKNVIKTKQKEAKVFSKEVAYILKELLKQPVEGADGTAKVCRISGMDVSAKTGTTNENYDKWLCGFTTYYTAVTWYGYDINQTIEYKGKSPAALLWSSVMTNIHSNLPKTQFERPGSIKQATICAKTGKTANSNCAQTYTEYFLSGTVPEQCVGCNSSTSGNKHTGKNTTNKKNTTNTENNNVKSETNIINSATNNTNTNKTNNTINETNKSNVNNKNNVTNNSTVNNTHKNDINNNISSGNNTATNENTTNTNNENIIDYDPDEDDGP